MHTDSFASAAKRGYMGMPVALRSILAVNVLLFIFHSLLYTLGDGSMGRFVTAIFGFIPEWGIALTQPWRLVTYMFLHATPIHIAFNMLWLWWMGRPVEQHLGPRNFLVIYFGSGIGGALINLVFSPFFSASITIGASGAVFGMMVAFAMLFPRTSIMLLFLPPIEARFLVTILIGIDLLLLSSADNIARIVHLGGALCGYLLLKLYQNGYHYDLWIENLEKKFKTRKKAKHKPSAHKTGRGSKMHVVTDAEIVEEYEEDELDRILEKISKSGYEGLTSREKRVLFELSKKK